MPRIDPPEAYADPRAPLRMMSRPRPYAVMAPQTRRSSQAPGIMEVLTSYNKFLDSLKIEIVFPGLWRRPIRPSI
jgi:hypothetical protein